MLLRRISREEKVEIKDLQVGYRDVVLVNCHRCQVMERLVRFDVAGVVSEVRGLLPRCWYIGQRTAGLGGYDDFRCTAVFIV